MSPKLALTIGAVLATLFGLALTFAPEQMLSGFGMTATGPALVLSRDIGVTLIGLAAINWLARDATGPAVRAILIGNIVVQALEAIVNGWEVAAGIIPSQALGGVVLHVILVIVFWLGLRRA